jgi:hypothetical protein
MNKTCKDCDYFIGSGDWDLCCTKHHEGYPFGFLCYEDTPICEKFDPKVVRRLNLDALKDRMVQGPSTEEALKDIIPFYEEETIIGSKGGDTDA